MSRTFFQTKIRVWVVAIALLAIVGLIAAGSMAVDKTKTTSLTSHATAKDESSRREGGQLCQDPFHGLP